MENLSIENTCRICFQKRDTLFSLYEKSKGHSHFDKLVKLKVIIEEGGPSSICSQCLIELDNALNFLSKCETSNRLLASHSRRETPCEEETKCQERLKVTSYEEEVDDFSDEADVNSSVIEAPSENLAASAQCVECGGSKRRCRHRTHKPRKHICQHCGKAFTRKYDFTLHLKRHRDERDWACVTCGSRHVTQWQARTHCAPKVRLACPAPECPKTFTTKTNLDTHIRVHSGERPYKCSECGKDFTKKNTLNEHLTIHTGEKPYVCAVCGKQFRTNKLSAHMASHGGSRAFSCALCGALYAHKQSLNQHLRKHHAQPSLPTPHQRRDLKHHAV